MLKILLVRHAQSKFNKIGRMQSQKYDSKLSEKGIKQAKKLAKRLAKYKINKIYSSDFKRAYQTAEIIAKSQNLEIIKEKDLREFNWGAFASREGIRKKWKEHVEREKAKGKHEYAIRPPNGESIFDLLKRLRRFLNKIRKEKGIIIVVAHGGPNSAFLNLIRGPIKIPFEKMKQYNTAVNFIEYHKGKWKIKKVNDTKHLN